MRLAHRAQGRYKYSHFLNVHQISSVKNARLGEGVNEIDFADQNLLLIRCDVFSYFGARAVLRTESWKKHHQRIRADFPGNLSHLEHADGHVFGHGIRVLGGQFVHQALGGP